MSSQLLKNRIFMICILTFWSQDTIEHAIFHLRSTGVSTIMYGLQYPFPCTFCPATCTQYWVPLSTVRMCAVVSGSFIIITAFLPSTPTTSYSTSQEWIASRVLTSNVGGLSEKGHKWKIHNQLNSNAEFQCRLGPVIIHATQPTCHSNVKVVEFRGSNLVIVGAGKTEKEKGKHSYSCTEELMYRRLSQGVCNPAHVIVLYSNQILLDFNWANRLIPRRAGTIPLKM